MKEWINFSNEYFNSYVDGFKKLSSEQNHNFIIKRDHSIRVAEISLELAQKLKYSDSECKLAYAIGILHDIGRFQQLVEFNTFNDSKSVNHAIYSLDIIQKENILQKLGCDEEAIVTKAILNHNQFKIDADLTGTELRHAKLIRDSDKLDILNVLSNYYTQKNSIPNHTLTWELPKSNSVSPLVSKEILDGKLVSKKNVLSDIDVKIMQMSWVYDFNFKVSYEYLIKKRYLEMIYSSLPKNDLIIEIYRKVKVLVENKMLVK